MRVIAHEMPDGTVRRSKSFEPMLAWLQVGRSPTEIETFVAAQIAQGASESEARRLIVLMENPEREIANRIKDPRYSLALATQWANGLAKGGLTAEAALNLIARISCPDAVRHVEVAPDSLPAEHAPYRSALKLTGSLLDWDMPKAHGIGRAMLRAERAKRFTNVLDGQWMRATARGEAVVAADVEAKRETLRNWPADPRIVNTTTPDELNTLIQQMKGN